MVFGRGFHLTVGIIGSRRRRSAGFPIRPGHSTNPMPSMRAAWENKTADNFAVCRVKAVVTFFGGFLVPGRLR